MTHQPSHEHHEDKKKETEEEDSSSELDDEPVRMLSSPPGAYDKYGAVSSSSSSSSQQEKPQEKPPVKPFVMPTKPSTTHTWWVQKQNKFWLYFCRVCQQSIVVLPKDSQTHLQIANQRYLRCDPQWRTLDDLPDPTIFPNKDPQEYGVELMDRLKPTRETKVQFWRVPHDKNAISVHYWTHLGTVWRFTIFQCLKCNRRFFHDYNNRRDIGDAMQYQLIPAYCPNTVRKDE
jgi:hypothetical protein